MLDSGPRGLHEHGYLHQSLHGGILRRHEDNPHNGKNTTQIRQRGNVFGSFSNGQSESDNPNGCVHRYTLSRALFFSALALRRTFDALPTLQHFHGSRSD